MTTPTMLTATATACDAEDPLGGLLVGRRPMPDVPDGWARVRVAAAALNHHDLWTLRGVGIDPARLPIVLGSDAAGIDDDGNEVIVHAVISSPDWRGDETLDPQRSILSEVHDGTLAEYVVVPRRNLVPKPPELTFSEAACLPCAWLTAYRMLFVAWPAEPGSTVLVQGAGGGVSTALVALGRAAGFRVWVTGRSEERRAQAVALGADRAFEPGARLPERVDAVMETVGAATWQHSLRCLKPGGSVVISGATSGAAPVEDLAHIFFRQLRVIGSTMGTRDELARLAQLCVTTGVRPVIDRTIALADVAEGLTALRAGDVFGKIVVTPG